MQNQNSKRYGEIWWTQCSPSQGNEFRDRHPTVIIQNDDVRRKNDSGVTTVMMSSYKGKRGPYDFLVPSSSMNGLLKPTLLKVEYIMSFDHSRFIKKIGALEDVWVNDIKKYLMAHFDLS